MYFFIIPLFLNRYIRTEWYLFSTPPRKKSPQEKSPLSQERLLMMYRRFYCCSSTGNRNKSHSPAYKIFFSHLPLSSASLTLSPDKRGQLAFCMLCFFFKLVGTVFLYDSFLYFCFYYIKTIILSSLVSASPALGGKCRALRGDRGMFAYTGQNR